MSDPLARDLLHQARRLLGSGGETPPQADLRRAVSAAYYALFHLLSGAAAALACPPELERLRPVVRRACDHGAMKKVCRRFLPHKRGQKGTIPEPWNAIGTEEVPEDLAEVAGAFVDLQDKRHAADYDLSQTFPRHEVKRLIDRTTEAFERWERVVGEHPDAARLFLLALLFGERVRR